MTTNLSEDGEQRVAVVTGGSGAIGSAIVTALRAAGLNVVTLDRAGDVPGDLSSEKSTRSAAALVLQRYGRCDVFVHCAGAFDQAALADVDLTRWRHVQSVNVESVLWLSQAFTPGMAEALVRSFASNHPDKFAGAAVHWLPTGVPAMVAARARIACLRHEVVGGGDHSMVLGLVVAAEGDEAEPLVWRTRFRSIPKTNAARGGGPPVPGQRG